MADVILGSKNDGAGFSRDYVSASEQRINTDATIAYTAGDQPKSFSVYVRTPPPVDTTINASIYDISGGAPGAVLVYTAEITVPTTAQSESYYTQSLEGSLSGVTGGEALALHLSSSDQSSPGIPGRRVQVATSFGASGYTPISPWVEESTNSNESPDAYFLLGEAGPSVACDGELVPGQTTTISTGSFAAPPTGARITGQDGNTAEITLDSATEVSLPSLGDQSYCLMGEVTLEVYNDTETATTTSLLEPPASLEYMVTLPASPSNTTDTGYLYSWSPDNGYEGAQILSPIPIDENGNIIDAPDGEHTLYAIDDTDGQMQPFTVTIQDGEAAPPGIARSITRRRLTRRKLTSRSLTARP